MTTIYRIRSVEPSATGDLFFSSIEKALNHITLSGRYEYKSEVELTEYYLSDGYNYKIKVLKSASNDTNDIYAFFPVEDEEYFICAIEVK